MKTAFIAFCLCFTGNIAYPVFTIHAQEIQTNATGTTTQVQSTQVPPPELPPTPRSKLEIIQYILLPFAIGASIWLIMRMGKMEEDESKGNEGQFKG